MKLRRSLILVLTSGLFSILLMVGPSTAQTEYQVCVVVKNSICGYPIEGAEVELAADAGKIEGLGAAITDADGMACFTNLPNAGPFEINAFAQGYCRHVSLNEGNVFSGDVVEVDLIPCSITTPDKPTAISSPKSVYIDWPANPEYDLKGYNVYRTLVTEIGEPLGEPVKLNGSDPVAACGDALIEGIEFIDDTVEKASFYVYQIQAISGADQPSELSEPSDPPIKGQWLTIFFPDVFDMNESDLHLWDRGGDGSIEARIPIASRCAYDVDATSIQIVAEITADLLNATPFSVELTGITAGIAYGGNTIANGAVENEGDNIVRISGAGVEIHPLYGSGELFNIYLTPVNGMIEACGPLHLSDDAITGDGVRFYNDPFDEPVEVALEDGTYCVGGSCLHGDADANGVINNDDVQYIIDFIAHQNWAAINECYLYSWDINLDQRVTTQDSTLIMRWVQGMDINPPYDGQYLAFESFAVAGAVATKADSQPTVWAENPVVALNAEGDVVVYISGAAPLAGFTLTAAYPAKEVEFIAATVGSDMPGDALISASYEITGETNEYGALTIAVTSTSSIKVDDDAELVKLTFKRITGDTAEVPLVLTSFDMNDQYSHAPRQTDPMAPIIKNTDPPCECEGEEGEGEGLIGATIVCTVMDSETGSPITNASVETLPATLIVTENNDGVYVLGELNPGFYTVNATASGYYSGSQGVSVYDGDMKEIVFHLIPIGDEEGEGEGLIGATIFCTVLDSETSSPITNASIETLPSTVTVTENNNGLYIMAAVASGSYTVTVTASGYYADSQEISVNDGDMKELTFNLISDCEGCQNEKERRILFCGATGASGSHTGDLVLLGLLLVSFAVAPYLRKRVN